MTKTRSLSRTGHIIQKRGTDQLRLSNITPAQRRLQANLPSAEWPDVTYEVVKRFVQIAMADNPPAAEHGDGP